MTYTLTVTKRSPNPNYDEELKKFNYGGGMLYERPAQPFQPSPFIEQNVLLVELTEAQYGQVKKGVLENW